MTPAATGGADAGVEIGGATDGGAPGEGGTARAVRAGAAGRAGNGGGGGAAGNAGTSGKAPTGGAGGVLGGTAGVMLRGGAPTSGAAGKAGGVSDLPCIRSRDCSGGDVCGERRADGRFYCTAPVIGGSTLGTACTTGITTDECLDRVCLVGVSSLCSRPCMDDTDCADVAGFVCTAVGASRFCMQSCRVSIDCHSGLGCVLSPNMAADRWDYVCELPNGPVAAGGDCTLVNNCSSGLCLYGESGLNYCSAPCAGADDCPSGLAACATVTVSKPVSGTFQYVEACVMPAAGR